MTHTLTRVSPTFESRASGSILMQGSAPRLEHTVPFEGLTPGFYRLDARFGPDAGVPAELRASTGFWIREPAVLARSRAMTADAFTLRRDGAPFIATGTTYMAGDVHRQFLLEPNPAIWHRDFAQMRRAGVNIVRTGIWTGWSRYMPEPGRMNEHALRALDAFMLTAAAHDMAVVFTFFAFTPPLWGGVNPYLDSKAVDAQSVLRHRHRLPLHGDEGRHVGSHQRAVGLLPAAALVDAAELRRLRGEGLARLARGTFLVIVGGRARRAPPGVLAHAAGRGARPSGARRFR